MHREEKIARGVSAAVEVRDLAEKQTSSNDTANTNGTATANGTTENENSTAADAPKPRVETKAAIYQDGKVHLKGNPLDTITEILCPDCHLPRLLYPLFGEGSRAIPNLSKEYCRKQPPMRLDKRDVHGRPYAIEKATKKKKNAPASPNASPPSSPSSTPAAASLKQLPGKTYVPSVKCPNCPRYFFLTRIAQHLDRCLGLSARQASRNRTPMDSGFSTPAPGANVNVNGTAPGTTAAVMKKRAREGDDEGGAGGPKKKKKPPVGLSKLKTGMSANTSSGGKAGGPGKKE